MDECCPANRWTALGKGLAALTPAYRLFDRGGVHGKVTFVLL